MIFLQIRIFIILFIFCKFILHIMAQNQSKIRIFLPPENWLDIFAYLPRRPTLTESLSFVCCQFWQISHILLHEKGQICLEKMHFDSEIVPASENNTGKKEGDNLLPKRRSILWSTSTNRKVPFPEVEMPENIIDFRELVISHLDEQCFQMLDKMSSILNGIHIWIDFDDDEEQQQSQAMAMFRQILHGFASKISIKSIQLNCADSVLSMATNFPQIWEKLEFVYFEEFIKIDDKLLAILCAWLNQNGTENQSINRFLTATVPERYAQMLMRQNIEEFHKSSHSSNYFVRLTIMGNPMENFVKRRELNQKVDDILTAEANFAAKIYSSHLYIFRHQIDADREWIEAMKFELDGWRVEKCCRRKMVLRVE